jgi:hypothetical protein
VTASSVDLLEEIPGARRARVAPPRAHSRHRDVSRPGARRSDGVPAVLAELIGYAIAHSQPHSITVRVTRTGKAARVEVINDYGDVVRDDLPDLASAPEELQIAGGEIGTARPRHDLLDNVADGARSLDRCRRLSRSGRATRLSRAKSSVGVTEVDASGQVRICRSGAEVR